MCRTHILERSDLSYVNLLFTVIYSMVQKQTYIWFDIFHLYIAYSTHFIKTKHHYTNNHFNLFHKRIQLQKMATCTQGKHGCVKWVEKYLRDCVCDITSEVSFGLGIVSLLCWGIAEIPQIITNFQTKSAMPTQHSFPLCNSPTTATSNLPSSIHQLLPLQASSKIQTKSQTDHHRPKSIASISYKLTNQACKFNQFLTAYTLQTMAGNCLLPLYIIISSSRWPISYHHYSIDNEPQKRKRNYGSNMASKKTFADEPIK